MSRATRTTRHNEVILIESIMMLLVLIGGLTLVTSGNERILTYCLPVYAAVAAGYLVWMWHKCYQVIFHDNYDGETRRYFGKLTLLAPVFALLWPVDSLHTLALWWLDKRCHYLNYGKWDRLTDWEHLRTLEADEQSMALQRLTERRISRYRWLVVARSVLFSYRVTSGLILTAVLLALLGPFVVLSIVGYPAGYVLVRRFWVKRNLWRVGNPHIVVSRGNGLEPYNQQHLAEDAKYQALRWPFSLALWFADLALGLVVMNPIANRLEAWNTISTNPYEVVFATPDHLPGTYYLRHRDVVCHVPADAIVWSPEMLN